MGARGACPHGSSCRGPPGRALRVTPQRRSNEPAPHSRVWRPWWSCAEQTRGPLKPSGNSGSQLRSLRSSEEFERKLVPGAELDRIWGERGGRRRIWFAELPGGRAGVWASARARRSAPRDAKRSCHQLFPASRQRRSRRLVRCASPRCGAHGATSGGSPPFQSSVTSPSPAPSPGRSPLSLLLPPPPAACRCCCAHSAASSSET